MKKYMLILAVSLSFIACSTAQEPHFDNEIGVLEESNLTITFDLEELKTQWEARLEAGGLTLNLDNFRIEFQEDPEYSYYLLLADDNEVGSAAAIQLILDGGKFYERDYDGIARNLVCKGCTLGCSPRFQSNGDGWCTSCTLAPQSENCTKTESATGPPLKD